MSSEWLNALVDRYERPLISYAARLLTGDWDRARDCVQETFLSLCQNESVHNSDHVEAWLFKCCRHRAMDVLRKESRMLVQYTGDQEKHPASPKNLEPSQQAMQIEEEELLQHRLQEQIAALSIRDQEVLSLRLQQGLTYKQIAEVMDLSVSNVGFIIHQSLTQLRECISNTHEPS